MVITVDLKVPSRAQLDRVAKGDPEMLRLLERLFQVAGLVLPESVEAVQAAAEAAQLAADAAQASADAAQVSADAALAAVGSLGTMSAQNANAVAITGGSATGMLALAATTVTGAIRSAITTLIGSNVALSNGAAAALGTLANAPVAGNPTKWVAIDDNGTTRFIPAW